jgi:hypothetical protein
MRRALVAVIATASCGRLDFDPRADARAATAPNLVFIATGTDIGALGNVSAADSLCDAQAGAAHQPGTFRAFLSTSTMPATARLAGARGWIRPDGELVADRPEDLLTRMYHPVLFSADGTRPSPGTVTTGTLDNGTPGATCGDYTTTTGTIQCGISFAIADTFASAFICTCNGPFSIYCFGVDRSSPVSPARATGRTIFLLGSGWTPGGGVTTADTACANAATSAGLAGNFRALLATSTASASSRFSAGAPWVRPDGVAVAATDQALFDSMLDSAPNVGPDGAALHSSLVFTGATDPRSAGTLASTCNDWTTGPDIDTGISTFAGPDWFHSPNTAPCSMPLPIYCLEL